MQRLAHGPWLKIPIVQGVAYGLFLKNLFVQSIAYLYGRFRSRATATTTSELLPLSNWLKGYFIVCPCVVSRHFRLVLHARGFQCSVNSRSTALPEPFEISDAAKSSNGSVADVGQMTADFRCPACHQELTPRRQINCSENGSWQTADDSP